MHAPKLPKQLLHPKYWPYWLLFALLFCISLLPYSLQSGLGTLLGNIIRLIANSRKRVIKKNIDLCFPTWSKQQKRELLIEHYKHLGHMMLETSLSWFGSQSRLSKLARFEGKEHLDKALSEGKKVVLYTGHMLSMEIGGQILATLYPLQVMYKSSRNPVMEWMTQRGRLRFAKQIFLHDDFRTLKKGLREGLVTWYAPDQDFGARASVFCDFLGVQTACITMTSRIAKGADTIILPYFPIRLENNKGYLIKISPQIPNVPSDDVNKDTQLLTTALADIVNQYPAQYFWPHRRFKTRPHGAASPYE